ncbi:pilus assembly protein PilP [uncultured Desulfuromusa sp.]|uniref:pilus assembly protein PilP n=1 Tax=uncultured Desulfuromusa sp. TaxID=219183 RepID=UPI002AA89C56|nr:pilus assembly protein PilP [uncultured Desulfuromusa sp.]
MKLKFLKSSGLLFGFLFFLVWTVVAAQPPSSQDIDLLSSTADDSAAEESQFSYSPKGRRDPFKPLIKEIKPVVRKSKARPDKVKGPLEQFELSQYRLIALMVVKGAPRAMVKAPDGKSYTVKVGEYIGMNDGIVKSIETKVIGLDENGLRIEKSPDRIVIEEIGIDSATGGEVKENRYIVM